MRGALWASFKNTEHRNDVKSTLENDQKDSYNIGKLNPINK